jgi:two-component system KDP operon response regulator KdpE
MKVSRSFVLLVEDDPQLRAIIAQNLGALGYMVFQAATFREAADQLALKPHLLILDIGLPDATGWDVAAWLESLTEPVPIIVISGAILDPRQVQRAAPVAVLAKPFAMDELLDLVQTHAPAA